MDGAQPVLIACRDELPGCLAKRQERHGPTVPGVLGEELRQAVQVWSDRRAKIVLAVIARNGADPAQVDASRDGVDRDPREEAFFDQTDETDLRGDAFVETAKLLFIRAERRGGDPDHLRR